MNAALTDEEKNFAAVALSKVQAIQLLLTPIVEKSLLISKAQVHLREVSILLSLAIYKKSEDSPESMNIFRES